MSIFSSKMKKEADDNSRSGDLNAATDRIIMEEIVDYLLNQPQMGGELIKANNGSRDSEMARATIMLQAKQLLEMRKLSSARSDSILQMMKRFLWGYHILEPLIDDESVSDIRIMSRRTIAVCRNGIWNMTNLSFAHDEFNSFMQSVAIMNQISLADINSLSVVTDKNSNPDWILRIAIATGYVNSTNSYFMQIRKHPKVKRTLKELEHLGMMPEKIRKYLEKRVESGLYITGRTGSGKTQLMNALIDLISHEPGIVMQESEELFATDVNSLIVFLHTVMNKGEGKIKYDLEDESKFGLQTSNKYFIVGEIKGGEAAYFANACYTGSVCWATGHGEGCEDGLDKLIEYIMRYTGYNEVFVRKIVSKLRTVIYMKDYKIMEIRELKGMDKNTGELVYTKVYQYEQEAEV